MAKRERNKNNQDQEIRHNLFVSTEEEVHSKIDIESGLDVEPPAGTDTDQGTPPQRHPNVKAEKNAARTKGNPRKGPHERIINPKNNSSNQYR